VNRTCILTAIPLLGAYDLSVQLPLDVQINKPRAQTNAPKRSKLSELFGSTDAMAFELLL
jgi:hypothetical protein